MEKPSQYMSLDVPPKFLPNFAVKGDMLWNKIVPVVRENGAPKDASINSVLVIVSSLTFALLSISECL